MLTRCLYHKRGVLRGGYVRIDSTIPPCNGGGISAHNEESRQESYRTNNRFESCTKDGILLMGSQTLTVDRASFLRSSILFLPLSPCVDSGPAVVLTPDTHERRPAKQVTVVLEIKSNAITRPPRELLRECL